tara:strand:+ start:11967 stop:12131 length:165 start_codon:yes stop_codon:yes gene_type:complete
LGAAALILLVISVPLSLSFAYLAERERILQRIVAGTIQLGGLQVHVYKAEVTLD